MKQEWLDSFDLDAEAGPAAPLESDEADALAAKAVERALSLSGGGAALRFHPSWMHLAIVGIGGALVAAGVYAASSAGPRAERAPASSEAPVSVTAPAPLAPPAPTKTNHAPVEIESVAVAALPNAPPPPALSARPGPKADDRAALEPRTASDLLADANHARRQSEWAEAAALYERVMRSQADESYAATVALASLRLEHFGDPRGALVLYEHALSSRPGGALSAQAEAGAARCRRALEGDEPSAR